MAPLFDSHCHFAPGDDIAGVLARAREAGLSGLLAVGGDAAADAGARAAAALAPGFALPAFGIDRTEAGSIPDPAALASRRSDSPSGSRASSPSAAPTPSAPSSRCSPATGS